MKPFDGQSRFEDDPPSGSYWRKGKREKQCYDPEHDPPRHLVIPEGKKYIHVCPTCGRTTILRKEITFGLNVGGYPEYLE